jgi:4-amino-4-deoxy-L-arabinose transferase-like glycosyltransferase
MTLGDATPVAVEAMPEGVQPSPHGRLEGLVIVAAAAALVVPVELVARAASRPVGWWDIAARSSVASLLLLVASAGAISARSTQSRDRIRHLTVLAVVVVGVRAVVAVVLDQRFVDPLGHGVLLPADAGGVLTIGVTVAALAAGVSLPHRAVGIPFAGLTATGAAAVIALVTVEQEHVNALASLLLALTIAAAVQRNAARPTSPTSLSQRSAWDPHFLGTALGAIAIAPHALRFVLDRYVERVAPIDGGVIVLGPLAPPSLWAGTLIVSTGVLLGTGVLLIGGRFERLPGLGWQRLVSSPAAFLPVIVAVAYLFRIWALITISTARRDSGDPFFYHVTANILAHGRGFEEPLTWVASGAELPSALHGPAFPAALALFSRLGGVSYVDHQWASVLFGLPQIVFAVLLAHMLAGRRAALLTGAVCIVYPNLWLTDGSLFVEGLAAGFTTAATWTLYRWIQRPRASVIVATGVLIGLAALTRGEALLLIPLFFGAVVLLLRSVGWRMRWTHALWGTIAAVVTLAPWMIYNAPRFNVFVPLSTNSNEVLFYANCDDVYSGSFIGFWSFDCQTRHRAEFGEAPGDQAEQAVYWRKLAVEYIKEHRDQLPKVIVARVGRQWELFRPNQTLDFAIIEGRDRTSVRIGQLGFYVMMPLAVLGSMAMRRRRQPILPMWSHAIGVTVTAVYAYGTLRFRAPWEPVMITLAAIGLVFIWDRWRPRRRLGVVPVEAPA